jgi:hypothetical protein
MGYGYAGTFLIVFLTHPGVILPTTSSATNALSARLPGAVADIIPSGGFPPSVTGLWQVLWVWILGLPGNKSAGFAWTMYIVYIVFLFLYMYLFLRVRMSAGV